MTPSITRCLRKGLILALFTIGVWAAPPGIFARVGAGLPRQGVVSTTPRDSVPVATLVVSPDGSDSNVGTLDRPFKTIEKARDVVRAINHDMTGDIVVYLRGGTYRLGHTLTFDGRDSGTNGHRIIYQEYQGETPLLSGGRAITGWQPDGQSGRWKARVEAGLRTRQLYVNGVRAVRARSDGNLAGTVKTAAGWTTTDTAIQAWSQIDDVDVVANHQWRQFHCGIRSVRAIGNGSDIVVKEPCWTASGGHSADPDADVTILLPAWFENAFALLDAPAEWYYDGATGWIYYMPRRGEDMRAASVVLPLLERLVEGVGSPAAPIHDLTIQGITFSFATWTDRTSDARVNAEGTIVRVHGTSPVIWQMPLANVSFAYVRHLDVSSNVFTHLGGAGLYLGVGSQDSTIVGNVFHDISSDGILLGHATGPLPSDPALAVRGNTINNNYITNVAAEYQGSTGMFINHATQTTVQHNEVANLPYDGIAIVVDSDKSTDNRVQYNHIHDVMKVMLDGGSLYSHGPTGGNVYSDNLLTNTNANSYGAIYLDDYSSNVNVYNNVIFNGVIPLKLKADSVHINVHDNWWNGNTPIDYTPSSWDASANANLPSSASMLMSNHGQLANLDDAPRAVIDRAGLEVAYRDIKRDGTAPSVPAGPSAAGVSTGLVSLAWNASTDDVEVAGYKIVRNGLEVAVSFATSYLDTGLSPATVYTYNISAYDAAGNQSARSRSVVATTMDAFIVTLSTPPGPVFAGDSVIVRWNATGQPLGNDWIGLYQTGTANSDAREWMFVTCTRTKARIPMPNNGACSLSIPPQLTPGTYELRYMVDNRLVSVAKSGSFTVSPAGGP